MLFTTLIICIISSTHGLGPFDFFKPSKNVSSDSLKLFNIPKDHWYCGTDGSISQRAIELVHLNCPSAAYELNHCCAIHDDCYSQQNGRKYCDDTFCACNDGIARIQINSTQCRGKYTSLACTAVNFLGGIAYSMNGTEKEIRAPMKIEGIEKEYKKLSTHCHYHASIFSSCSITYDECDRLYPNQPICREMLIKCMKYPGNRKNANHKCDKAIEHVVKIIEKGGEGARTTPRNVEEVTTTRDDIEVTVGPETGPDDPGSSTDNISLNLTHIHEINREPETLFQLQFICLMWIMMMVALVMCSNVVDEDDRPNFPNPIIPNGKH